MGYGCEQAALQLSHSLEPPVGISETESEEGPQVHFASSQRWDSASGLSAGRALPGNLQQPANNPQSNPHCQLWQCGILMTATWGFRSLLIYILGCGFLLLFFLTRFLGTSCWLVREDCYCRWEGRKPVCLHCWVRKTSESSCCPVSWHDENPYGYKNWNH